VKVPSSTLAPVSVTDGDAGLGRLRTLVARLSDEELRRSVSAGWTVSAALAHLAFWDRRAAILLERWRRGGPGPSAGDVVDSQPINDAALPQWLALPPRSAAADALAAAEAVRRELAQAPEELLQQIVAVGSPIDPNRGNHRIEHLDEIEGILGLSLSHA
jgi:hypothetical protein